MSYNNDDRVTKGEMAKGIALIAFIIVLVFALLFGIWFGVKAISRHQKLADANNNVKVAQINARNQIKLNEIDIASQGQRIKVATQKAQIRLEDAKGLREAQDEVAKTLTPLYVQFEMVDALKQIAISGRNNTVVYIPSGDNGIPLVSGAAGQPSVGGK
jgi:hypothetical protein